MSTSVTNLSDLHQALSRNPETPLVFSTDGITINSGYHVTEVKHAMINSLDCGKGADSWHEVIIQLLDGSALNSDQYMSCNKFLGIVNTGSGALDAAPGAELYFEYCPGNGTLQRMQIKSIDSTSDTTTVYLNGAKPGCKPLTRALGNIKSSVSGCCGSAKAASSCCSSS